MSDKKNYMVWRYKNASPRPSIAFGHGPSGAAMAYAAGTVDLTSFPTVSLDLIVVHEEGTSGPTRHLVTVEMTERQVFDHPTDSGETTP